LFLVLGIVLVGVGVMRDVTQSELDKGPDGGALDGTLRPVSRKGLRKGLPWYVVGGLLSALAVLLS
jgi:hypothetical protein